MAIQYFGNIKTEARGDVPWLKQYRESNPGDSEARRVYEVHRTEKGFLLVTDEWKAFVFKEQSSAKHLDEALAVWVTQKEPVLELVAQFHPKYKVVIGLNDESQLNWWAKEDNSYYQKYSGGGEDETSVDTNGSGNPLLPDSTPRTTAKNIGNTKPRR